MNLALEVLRRAKEVPDRDGFHFQDGRKWTFREIDDVTRQISGKLIALGVKEGDYIGVYMKNSPELVFTILSLLRIGAVYVPANLMLYAAELKHILVDANCVGLVASTARPEVVKEAVPEAVKFIGWWGGDVPPDCSGVSLETFEAELAPAEPADLSEDAPAIVIYTSGTTGQPKGALQTHGSMISWLYSLAQSVRNETGPYSPMKESTPPNVSAMPLSHGTGMLNLFFAWVVGRPVCLMERFTNEKYIELVIKHKADNLWGAPTMYQMLANSDTIDPRDLSQVKIAQSGGAPLLPAVAQRFEQRFGIPLIQTYGSSESGPIAGGSPADVRKGLHKAGSVGRPYPNVTVRVVDENFDDVHRGETGEIIAQSPNLMQGYLNRESDQNIRAGWYLTGDVGYMDEDDFVFITGRKRSLIIVGGFNVYPAELENVISQHPSVEEVVVVRIPDDRLVEVPKAFVVLRPGYQATEKEIIEFCRERLSHYKVPRVIEFVGELPKGGTRKINVAELEKRTSVKS